MKAKASCIPFDGREYVKKTPSKYYPTKNVPIRRTSYRKCKVVGTDTQTIRRYSVF